MSQEITLDLLRREISGEVIEPSSPTSPRGDRVFYQEFAARRPRAVIEVVDAPDVSRVVGYARETGIELAVRAGGHSIMGHSSSDGGLVLDLSRLKDIDVDRETRTAWAGAGLLAGEYTAEVGKHGLITGFGDTPSVGIAGITLGGGVGFLHRKLGLTLDNLLGAEIVTADGAIRHVDEESDPDLFWAIRGGGGNFGVVTKLHYHLHPLPTVLGGMMVLPATPRLVADFVEWAREADDDLSVIGGIAVAPPLPFLPDHVHGELVLMAMLAHAGEGGVAEGEVGRLRSLGTPLVDTVQEMPFTDIYEGEEGPPQPVAISGRSLLSDGFSVEHAEQVIASLRSATADMNVVQIRVLGGEVARVPADATAFAHRDRAMIINVAAVYSEPARRDEHEAWVEGLQEQVRVGPRGAYLNFHADDSSQAMRDLYPGSTWERLVDVKTKYDQDNIFRSNHNVEPRP